MAFSAFHLFNNAQVLYMVKQDTCDSFRLFEILEKYMYQPETFRFQNICQLPLNDRLKMVEKYYELDDIGTTYPPTYLSNHLSIDQSINLTKSFI
jgi:hypothetical protein